MRTLGPSSAALAQSSWSLLLRALVTGPFLGRIASCMVSFKMRIEHSKVKKGYALVPPWNQKEKHRHCITQAFL